MAKTCLHEACTRSVFSNLYCLVHQYLRTDAKAINKRTAAFNIRNDTYPSNRTYPPQKSLKTPIKKASKKRAEINSKQYEPEARAFRSEKKICEVCIILRANGIKTQCTGRADCVHHLRGKATIKLLLDKSGWMASCWWGNGWVEDNSELAKVLKLKIPDYTSKLSNVKKL